MALSKSITHSSGAVTSYHRIDHVVTDKSMGVVRITLGSFVNAQARQDGKSPDKTIHHTLVLADIFPSVETPDTYWAKLYTALKASAPFSGATDI